MEADDKRNKAISETKKHIERVKSLLSDVCDDIDFRSAHHDNSKLEEPEVSTFIEYTGKLKDMIYGSDEYKKCLGEMQESCLKHHYAHNRHHPEHFDNGINGMNLIDIIEMFIDWKAASERHANGCIVRSIEVNKDRFGLSDQLADILFNTARDLGWLK